MLSHLLPGAVCGKRSCFLMNSFYLCSCSRGHRCARSVCVFLLCVRLSAAPPRPASCRGESACLTFDTASTGKPLPAVRKTATLRCPRPLCPPRTQWAVGQRSRAWLWRLFWSPPAALISQTVGGSGFSHRCCDVTGKRKMDWLLCKRLGGL